MDLHTYSSIWKLKRVVYRLEDIQLPVPVAVERFLLYAVCFLGWAAIWGPTIGFGPFLHLFPGQSGKGIGTAAALAWYAAPPYFTVRALSKQHEDGETLWQMLTARAAYAVQPKTYRAGVSQRHITWWLRYRSIESRCQSFIQPSPHRKAERQHAPKAPPGDQRARTPRRHPGSFPLPALRRKKERQPGAAPASQPKAYRPQHRRPPAPGSGGRKLESRSRTPSPSATWTVRYC